MAVGSGRTESGARRRRGTNRPAELWSTINRVLALVVIVTTLVALALWIFPEISKRNDLARALEEKRADLADEQRTKRQRERERFLLENDTEYIEAIARDKLDLMKEGETIFRLEPAPAASPGAAP
jgi:cell division protein FtsB